MPSCSDCLGLAAMICFLPFYPFYMVYRVGRRTGRAASQQHRREKWSKQARSSRKDLLRIAQTRHLLLRKLPVELVDEIRAYDPETHYPSFVTSSSIPRWIPRCVYFGASGRGPCIVLALRIRGSGSSHPVRRLTICTEGMNEIGAPTILWFRAWKVGREEDCEFNLDGPQIEHGFFFSSHQLTYDEHVYNTGRYFFSHGLCTSSSVWEADHPALRSLQMGDRLVIVVSSVRYLLENARAQLWCM
ncbi:hypothetical protein BT69DRAFT_1275977 [Atractiella rhizophila]|nr:hypothetical protein BT69DRAFT_1275977 [Atractiella rhizophila]